MDDGSYNPQRIEFLPITLFAIVMGLSGLTMSYYKAHEILNISILPYYLLSLAASSIFMALVFFYSLKLIKYPHRVKSEFSHPIKINFFATISISLVLLSAVFNPIYNDLSFVLWVSGSAIHMFFTLYTISLWINKNFDIGHSNPAWFIPIVGNVLVPVVGMNYGMYEISLFFFAVGIFFWINLFTVIFYRIIFHNQQLQEKFMPTLFILIAPPAVGFISYYKLAGELDMVAESLYFIALFFTMLLGVMYKNFLGLKFFVSWWAFTFPLAAITLATMLMYDIKGSGFYQFLSWVLLLVTTVVIAIVSMKTIQHIAKKEICIEEK